MKLPDLFLVNNGFMERTILAASRNIYVCPSHGWVGNRRYVDCPDCIGELDIFVPRSNESREVGISPRDAGSVRAGAGSIQAGSGRNRTGRRRLS